RLGRADRPPPNVGPVAQACNVMQPGVDAARHSFELDAPPMTWRIVAMTMSLARGRDSWLLAMAFCVGATTIPAHADYPVAPDVVVFCEPTLQHAVAGAAALWRNETGVPVRIFTSPTSAMLQQISH